MNNNWGYHPDDTHYKTPFEVISIFAGVVGNGGPSTLSKDSATLYPFLPDRSAGDIMINGNKFRKFCNIQRESDVNFVRA